MRRACHRGRERQVGSVWPRHRRKTTAEEPSPRRRGRRPVRDVTLKHVELQDTGVVVRNSRVAEEDRGGGGWARRTDPASHLRRAGPAIGRGRCRPGRSAGWPRGRGPPPRNDECPRAQHARLAGFAHDESSPGGSAGAPETASPRGRTWRHMVRVIPAVARPAMQASPSLDGRDWVTAGHPDRCDDAG